MSRRTHSVQSSSPASAASRPKPTGPSAHPAKSAQSPSLFLRPAFWGGVGFTALFAAAGYALALLPGLQRVGPMACAILLAVLYRQFAGYPEAVRPGIQFVSKRVLRLAIILYGLKLNMDVVLTQGLPLLVRDAIVIVFAITVMMLIAKKLKADPSLSLLLAVGTGVCGAAAIAAVSPIVKAKEEDTAIGVGIIALLGTLFAIGYTLLRPLLPLSDTDYGAWAGVSLHEIAHVALAGAPAGEDGLATALLAKLGRVFLLIPLCFLLVAWQKRRSPAGDAKASVEMPYFLLGFLAMSLIGTYVLGSVFTLPAGVMAALPTVTTFLLSMAMVGLGLNVHAKSLGTKALRPLGAIALTSVALSVLTYLTI
ncbi:membrane protein [Paenibacillus sp. J31TS4]|uniref:YeiH family protein n=1 Tax=Paenibacillus sp. J31TS4 TaxID=2807195 RepID=UPI001B2A9DAD|nr:putative sulfate exporter family transporter [Paenibacillus sp. J31TS4]GIP39347.1 membrane protein [Paenibacillus sp. J31TS4]